MRRFSSFLSNFVRLSVIAAIGVSFAAPAFAQSSQPRFASLESYRGRASVVRLGNALTLQRGMALQRNDVVVTREGSLVLRFYSDGSQLRVGANSRVQINESAGERDIEVFGGRLWARVVSWKERPVRFRSGSTIAAVRGTELAIEFVDDTTVLSALEGQVQVENDDGSVMVGGGQSAVVEPGKGPQLRTIVRPQDAVQWALYFEPVLYQPKTGGSATLQGTVSTSAEAYRAGDLEAALDAIAEVDAEEVDDAGFFTYRASLLLAASNVDQADADIERALELDPDSSDALALRAVIAVAGNDSDNALATAERAVAADPQSATAQIAMSYAKQSIFDLDGVRAALEQAVALDPDNALAWARLSEVHLAFGKVGKALTTAERAAELEPNLARTQSVLGYAYLAQVRVGKAKAAFEKAIELDQGDPLPRLGLGLAKIRDGALKDGAKEIETATSLDPGNSLIRSYLGKTYYELKMAGLDDREYGLAKQFDPNDPTPWFYEAIAKQTTNRPVEALRDMSQAIELNDNRGVYRSRLLLDSDEAARSASLGRIYGDLGFQSRALVEGWNSVNTDPANYSAHRLLADSYSARPRHEIARVSELFQSQMLQPLNTTPIQPRLGESNLFLITSQGPAELAFNEFNPLFNRDQVNFQGSFLAGEDATLAGEGIVSGIYKKFSFSAGYSGFETDGFRENNHQEDRIGNIFTQLELSPSTSVQAEVRHRKLETGDLNLNFFEDDFSEFQEEATEGTNVRVGLRQDFGPGLTLLASYLHSDVDIDFSLPEPDFLLDFNIDRNEKADSFEGQLLYGSSSVNVVGGVGYFDVDATDTTIIAIDDPFFGFTDITTSDTNIKHTNLYLYSYLSLLENLTLTLGLSGDIFEEDGEFFSEFQIPGVPPFDPVPIEPPPVLGEQDQANPKVGITWRVGSGTTLRAAWFRTLKRTLITDQTLEPTQVAGFNQFFDDPSATKSEVYGAAIDQKFSEIVFGGLEYAQRELTIPQTLFQFGPEGPTVTVEQRPGDERLTRAYLFAAPHAWFTFGVEYNYEDIELAPELFFPYSQVKTHRVPLSARFFHPSGFSALLGATYLDQDGDFLTFNEFGENVFVPGQKDFWVVDAALRYRLPKRYGFLVAGVNNLTDERSTYQATDPRNLSIRPGRVFFASVVVAFP